MNHVHQQLDERRFAGAVVPDEGKDSPAGNGHRERMESLSGAVALGKGVGLDGRGQARSCGHSGAGSRLVGEIRRQLEASTIGATNNVQRSPASALTHHSVERKFAASVLRLGHGECRCGRGNTHNLATIGADGFLWSAKAGDEIAKRCHNSKAPGEMGSVELSTVVHTGLEVVGNNRVVRVA